MIAPKPSKAHTPRGFLLVQNQGALLAMVSSLFPPLIKGGQGGFTAKVRHARRGLVHMH